MVNRRPSKSEDENQETNPNTDRRNRGLDRKESRTSELSDNRRDNNRPNSTNKKNGSKNVDGSDYLRKRDNSGYNGHRKRSVSSSDSDESQDRRKSRKQPKKDKKGRFDSSDDESNSIEASDKKSISDERDNKRNSSDRYNDNSNKRQKQNTDNSEYEVYFGEVSFDAREEDIRKFFGNCGQITQVKLLTREDGKSRGKGFVKFADEKSMKNALRLHNTEMMGRKIVVEQPMNSSAKRTNDFRSNNGGPESSSIIVRNLPYNLQEDELGNIFENCGSIKRVRIIKKETGESKGFGFVDFESPAEAKNALGKSGLELNGRSITVDFSIPKDNRNSSGFGRGFGNNRGRDSFRRDRPQRGFRRYD